MLRYLIALQELRLQITELSKLLQSEVTEKKEVLKSLSDTESQLSGVKKEDGMAVRLKSEFNLSDFNKSSISYSKKEYLVPAINLTYTKILHVNFHH